MLSSGITYICIYIHIHIHTYAFMYIYLPNGKAKRVWTAIKAMLSSGISNRAAAQAPAEAAAAPTCECKWKWM
jgi:hypothetical protein